MSATGQTFLDVENSASGNRWVERLTPVQHQVAGRIAEDLDLPELIARVLASRGVGADEAEDFLNPTLRHLLPDPSSLTDADKAAKRLAQAVRAQEHVAIFGDYDVDGAASSALLAKYIRSFGARAEIYIPDRIFEGYGPSDNAIRELIEEGATLLVTVDCGSVSHGPLSLAKELGADVVVIDHHQVEDELPRVDALVNPNRQDDMSGQGHLCAAGVVFMVLVGVNRHLRESGLSNDQLPDLRTWLDLVALATVCDVVPLVGVNRAFVTRGVANMRNQSNQGLVALARAAKQDGPTTPFHLGFVLGPRINAGGRIGDAALGAKLLTETDPQTAQEIAEQLDQLNRERQAMEREMLKQAIDQAEAEIGLGEGPGVLLVESDTWHAGVVGLLASRLKDRFKRPVFAVSFDHRGIGSGSGRSIHGVDLGAVVRAAVEGGILVKGGGHAMAAGITIDRDKVGAFRRFLEEHLDEAVRKRSAIRDVSVDGAMGARAATVEMFDLLDQAGPFGQSHPQPVLAFPRHVLTFADVVGDNHVRFSIRSTDGAELRGIGFRIADQPLGQALLSGRGKVMHFLGNLSADFYRGTKRVQLRIIDAAEVE